ncbi:MAG TPA: DUF1707 domain-containing protein [Trebonia sp.]|nr:DUF1707 domain-containing protein [Trebonia sp.]
MDPIKRDQAVEESMAAEFEMRVGHAEREAVATELREHYAVGRLTLDELNERLDKAFAAKTRADLNALMTDLPSASGTAAGTGGAAGPAGSAGAGRDWNTGGGWSPGGGPGGGWGPGVGPGGGGRGAGPGAGGGPGRVIAPMFFGSLVLAGLLIAGGLSLFGMGGTRPFGIVLIIAALSVLRRLFFRRRGTVRGCGPRRRHW